MNCVSRMSHQRKTSCHNESQCVLFKVLAKWDLGCHLVMRIKLLNDAGVAAESPPSQHEQIFDVSQVTWSVGIELHTNTRNWLKLPFSHFHSVLLHMKSFFMVLTWCSSGGRLSGVYSKVKQLSSSLCMTSAWDWTGKASATCNQE